MKTKLPDGVSLLILAAIDKRGPANVVELGEAIASAAADQVPAAALFAYLDTIVQRGQAIRAKGAGASATDTFELTPEGQALIRNFAKAICQLVPHGSEDEEGRAA